MSSMKMGQMGRGEKVRAAAMYNREEMRLRKLKTGRGLRDVKRSQTDTGGGRRVSAQTNEKRKYRTRRKETRGRIKGAPAGRVHSRRAYRCQPKGIGRGDEKKRRIYEKASQGCEPAMAGILRARVWGQRSERAWR